MKIQLLLTVYDTQTNIQTLYKRVFAFIAPDGSIVYLKLLNEFSDKRFPYTTKNERESF